MSKLLGMPRIPGAGTERTLHPGCRWRVGKMKRDSWIQIKTPLPGPKAQSVLEKDHQFISPSYSRPYPLVAESGEGMVVIDVDGNTFLDFSAGIAVCATGHCHPRIVKAVQDQASRLIHMSGTDFYYPPMA